MTRIISSTELYDRYDEISALCNNENQAVYITHNGERDLVAISVDEYEYLSGRQELIRLLQEGYEDVMAGRTLAVEEAFAQLREEFDMDV